MTRACPRCLEVPLRVAAGALHEDICPECRGRFLDGDTTIRLFSEHLGISREILLELTREGPRRLSCPGCTRRMTLTLVRGVQVDLCGGCGGSWLDEGELTTLSRATLVEVRALPTGHAGPPAPAPAPSPTALLDEARAVFGPGPQAPPPRPADGGSGLELERAPRQGEAKPGVALVPDHAPELPQTFAARRALGGFEVCCINCDQPLDLSQTNWLINQRPWCPSCAAPHTGIGGAAAGLATAALAMFGGRRLAWRVPSFADAFLNGTDTMKVPPDHAEVFFGPFFRPITPR